MDATFLAAQGEYVPTTTIYQDNKSTISSSSKRTRHLNVSYYFITDQIKKGHVKVVFCPTQDMIADFFMKPLQGVLFVHMCKKILNLPASKIANIHRSVLKDQKSIDPINAGRKIMSTANAGEIKMTRRERNKTGTQD